MLTLESFASNLLDLRNKQEMTAQSTQQTLATLSNLEGRVAGMENNSAELTSLTSQVCFNSTFDELSTYSILGFVKVYDA